jgi:hypothetical protein
MNYNNLIKNLKMLLINTGQNLTPKKKETLQEMGFKYMQTYTYTKYFEILHDYTAKYNQYCTISFCLAKNNDEYYIIIERSKAYYNKIEYYYLKLNDIMCAEMLIEKLIK